MNRVGEILEKEVAIAPEVSKSSPPDPEVKSELSELELVFEKYANTPMVYMFNGVPQRADGSYQARELCIFLQNDKLPPVFFEIKFQEAARLRAELDEQEALAPNESDDDANEKNLDDTHSAENEAEDALRNTAKPEITSESKPKKIIETKISVAEAASSESIVKANPLSEKGIPDTKSKSDAYIVQSEGIEAEDVPVAKPIELHMDDTTIEPTARLEVLDLSMDIEPDATLLGQTENETLAGPDEVAVDDHIEDNVVSVVGLDTTNITAIEIEPELKSEHDSLIDQTSLRLDIPVEIDSSEPIPEDNSKQSPVIATAEISDTPSDEVYDLSVLPTVAIPVNDTEVLVTHFEDDMTVVDEVHELLTGLSNEIVGTQEPESNHEEVEPAKIEKLYKCLDAQIKVLSDIDNDELTDAMKVDAMHNSLVAILEEAQITDADLAARLYLEEYGMSGLLDISRQSQSPVAKVSHTLAEQCKKVARFATTLLVRFEKSTS